MISLTKQPAICISLGFGVILVVVLFNSSGSRLPIILIPSSAPTTTHGHSLLSNSRQPLDLTFPARVASTISSPSPKGKFAGEWKEPEICTPPKIEWQRLPRHRCTMMEKICIDQNRFIAFDNQYLRPGATFEAGRPFFQPLSTHNIPGYPDNVKGTKTAWFQIMARANSTRDPPDIRHPSFQKCRVPLIWWPWWAFNPSEFYLSSVLQMESLQRDGIIDRGVQFVPVLDGLESMPFHSWWLAPFSDHKVESLDEMSAPTRVGERCFERVVLCDQHCFWNWPPDGSWLEAVQPHSVAQQIVEYHLRTGERGSHSKGNGPQRSIKVALIERRTHRKILNLDEVAQRCRGLAPADGSALSCTVISFDDITDYPALLRELQTIDILVGMHGAGLINSYFMRPGTAFVEIFPCNFGIEHHRYYYWHPSHVEAQTYAFQLYVSDPARCKPSALAATPEALNHEMGPDFVQQTLLRDQDIILDFEVLADMLSRALPVLNGTSADFRALLERDPGYFVIGQT